MGILPRTRERLVLLSTAARASHEQAEDDRGKRNLAIFEADTEHVPLKEIARICQMSPSHVQRIIRDATADRQQDLADQIEEIAQ